MTAIELDGVGKRYRQYSDEGMLLKRLALPFQSREYHDIWALRGISFEADEGETVGVIGRNGSGKTTLLRLLSGVTAPTTGRVRVVGRVAPLIGVGVGFNEELTGRENVHVNGRLLGLSEQQVEERFDDIVAFSEIGEFIDVPVKFYSSGMFLRLGFSIVIHTDPDIIAIDEILAVGDVAFRAKCFERMRALQDAGATVVIVTHSLQILQRMAPRTLVLDAGELVMDSDTEEAVRIYHRVMDRRRHETGPAVRHDAAIDEGPAASIGLDLRRADGESTVQLRADEPARAHLEVVFKREVDNPVVGVAIDHPTLGLLFAAANDPTAYRATHGPGDPLRAQVDLERLPLLAGTYLLKAVIKTADRDVPLASADPVMFHVTSDRSGLGPVDVGAQFTIEGRQIPVDRARLRGAPDPEAG